MMLQLQKRPAPTAPQGGSRLTINRPGDRYEREADRAAEFVMAGNRQVRPSLSRISGGAMQREETKPAPPKPNNYDDAVKKIVDALKETPAAKELQAQAMEKGKDFIGSVEGKVIAGSALGGALAAIIATNSELPMQIPEIPLDFIAPGLKAKLTWQGPSRAPTNAGLVLTTGGGVSFGATYSNTPASGIKPAEEKAGLSLTIPLGGSAKKKPGPSESDKIKADTTRLRAEQKNMGEVTKTQQQRDEDKQFWDSYWRSKAKDPLSLTGPLPKKDDDLLLMRKEASGGATPASAPPIVHDVIGRSGQPLDSSTRAFMEKRFGHDFGDVRVHLDEDAAASARAVNALAYTVGRDIVFGPGASAPGDSDGRRLLAHELAHVVQQRGGSSTVQRAPVAGLEVTGRQSGSGDAGSWTVFFERNGDTLNSDGQIAVLLAGGGSDNKKAFDLRGHVSEDEATSPATGKALAEKRIKKVDGELKSIGHTGKRNPEPLPDTGDGRLDYRNVRSVEIAPAGAKAATPNCKKTAKQGPCGSQAEKDFKETRKQGQDNIDASRRLLTSGTDASTNDLRDEFFGGAGGKGSGAAVIKTIDANLGKIRDQMDLSAKPKQHQCGTLCDGVCTQAIAYNEDVGTASMLTLCPIFVTSDKRERTRNFIHETAHATPGLGLSGKVAGTKDLSYRYERRLPRLTPDQALQNSDSYSLFVMLSADPAFARPPRPADTLSVSKTEKNGVESALASLSDWMKWSTQETGSTYATMVESRPPKKAWTNSYYEDTMTLIAAQFGLTKPPSLPSDDDRITVAGIADRYKRMQNRVKRDLKVKRDGTAKKTEWSAGPGDSVVLGDDFFALKTSLEQTRLLTRVLVEQMSDIVPAHRSKFVLLAEQLNDRNPLP